MSFPASLTGWLGACQITSGYNVIALAQIRYPAGQNASAYQAIPGNGSSKTLFFPVIEKRLTDGSATGILVQNLSQSSSTGLTFYYKASCPGYSDVTVGPYWIGPGESLDHNHRVTGYGTGTGQHNLPDGWCGSLKVVSSNEAIAGFGQLTNYLYYTSGDTIMAYNAVAFP